MCFSIYSLKWLLIDLVVIGAVVAVVKLLLPYVLAQFGLAADLIVKIINIILWTVILIAIIVLAFDLLSCLPAIGIR